MSLATQHPLQVSNAEISNDFVSKLKHESLVSNIFTRSHLFKIKETPPIYDIWKLQPPNFNPQAFEPDPSKPRLEELVRLKAEYEIEAAKSKAAPNANERRRNDKRLHDLFDKLREMAASEQRAKTSREFRTSLEKPNFQVRFQPMDVMQSKIDFTRHGIHKRDIYTAPQPHDYRQVRYTYLLF